MPYFGPTRPFRTDQTIDGHRFQLGGHAYERGLGTQSRTLLAYKLKPGDRRFQATVGVDDRAGPLGSVVFRVLVDGKPAADHAAMTAQDAPRSIDIDISAGESPDPDHGVRRPGRRSRPGRLGGSPDHPLVS